MKRILIISPHNPFERSNGGENRIFLLSERLSEKNKVILICPKGKTTKNKFKVYQPFEDNSHNKTFNYSLMKEIKKIIKKENPDEIRLEFPWQSINLILLGKRYTLDEHNIEFLRFKRTGSRIWRFVFLYEWLSCKFAKRIICVSQTDKIFLVKYFRINPEKITIIDNPVDNTIFFPNSKVKNSIRKKLNLKTREKFILFFGQLNYHPNVEALEIIRDKIIPELEKKRSKYKIVVCGKGDGKGLLKEFNHPNLIFKGFVEKIQDYINASVVVIAPLYSLSGTRIKILEALACNKRVISTSIGAEGINKNKYLEVEDDGNEFVKKI